MTREIKFRAWDKESSTMIYPGEFSHDEFYLECCDGKPFLMLSPNDEMDDGFSHPEHREKSAIMQFTGFKDKKGKEIYEGDITEYDSKERGRRLVKWDIRRGQFFLQGGYDGQINDTRIIVIGNIYENPELLEE